MRKYIAVAKAGFMRTMEYRLDMVVANLQSVFTLFILFFFWKTVFTYKQSMGGYSFEEIVTFYFLVRVTQNRTSPFEANNLATDIKKGTLTAYIVKPIDLVWYRVVYKSVIGNIWSLGNLIAILLFSQFLYTSLVLPKNAITLLLFLAVFILNGILSLLINIIIGSLGFWITEVTHLKTVTYQVISILSGSLIPLTFFPSTFNNIVNYLPFKFLAQFPVDIYLGKLTTTAIINNMLLMGFWLVTLAVFAQLLFKKGLKVYESFN